MKRKALFIGVNEYKDPAIRNLSCSVRDAISMHDIFEELGYQTNLLENPGKGDVFHAIGKITSDMAAGDQFLFYFAGHGFTDSGQHLLFCADDIHEHLRFHRAGIPFDLLELETRKGGYGRAFLLDACQSDFLTGTRGEDATTRDLVAISDMVPKSEDVTGAFYVLRSCSKYEHALEIESRKHGLFTLAMIDILRQSKNSGMELLFSDSLRETVRAKMYCIAQAEGITARQTPESDGRGAVQVLISGMKMGAASVMVDCPVCGRHNRVEETFKCKICGRDHLCASHFSDEGNCCKDCAKKLEVQANTKRAIAAYNVSDYASAFAFAQKSDQNDAEIQYIIGCGFDNGYGCDKNQSVALIWYRKSAEQGNAEAQYAVGKALAILFDERRRRKEEYEGIAWLRKAAEHGHIEAEYYIGYYLWWYYDTHYDYAPKEFQTEGVSWLNKAAEHGHVNAQCLLGDIYRSGDGAEKDYETAVRWYRDAAEQGSSEAQYELGCCYEQGCGVTADLTEAAHWYYYAAEQGYKDAEYKLGCCFYNGKGYSQNYAEAAKWYRKAAEQGHAGAEIAIGEMYEVGKGVDRDYAEAARWYHKAAENGNIYAEIKMGDCYFYGRGVPKKVVAAEKWYRKAAERGHSDAQCKMGDLYRTGGAWQEKSVRERVKEAIKWYRKAAEQDNAKAQYELSSCLVVLDYDNVSKEALNWLRKSGENGYGDAQHELASIYAKGNEEANISVDAIESARWYKLAEHSYRKEAERGNISAQYNLGLMLYKGEGVIQDFKEAVKWLSKAAANGSVSSQYYLGNCFARGQGVSQDYVTAVKWYRKAAERGDANAQYELGCMHKDGTGVEQDYKEAISWFHKAAEKYNDDARIELARMYSKGMGVVQDYKEAAKWYLQVRSNRKIQYELGLMYENGYGVKKDYEEAELCYSIAAIYGNMDAAFRCGYFHYHGMGVEKNYARAIENFREAATNGHSHAQYYLGFMYYNGEGVEQNNVEAAKWFIAAAMQGDADAQYALGVLCQSGRGVKKNDADAMKWYRKASEQGHEDAAKSLEGLTGEVQLGYIGNAVGGNHKSGDTYTLVLPNGAKMEMIWCPPGEFMMGSPATEEGRDDDETQHSVRLTKGFWLGKYPVTQKQWQSVMGSNPSYFKGDDLPVENVSWDDCQEFIAKVNASLGCGARLPTEAEWECACRAGTKTAYFWGNALNGDKANCDGRVPCGTETKGPHLEKTTPVGHYGANPWGFCDMHGNVWEWCGDFFGNYPRSIIADLMIVVDPTGPASGDSRVMRGGGWSYDARSCRSANRRWGDPGSRDSDFSFRLCCSVEPCG